MFLYDIIKYNELNNIKTKEIKDMKKLWKVLKIILTVLFALTLALCVSVAEAKDGFLPAFLPVAAYEADNGSFASALPLGSLAIVEKDAAVETGDLVAVDRGGETVFAALEKAGENSASVYDGKETLKIKTSQIKGRVFYYVKGVGRASSFVRQYASVVWALCGIVMLAVAVYLLTIPGRRRKREVDSLIKLFEYYGDKYDKEDEGVYY